MNWSAKEFEFGTLGFYLIELCSTCVSDFVVHKVQNRCRA